MQRPDVDKLLDELTPAQITEWRAYLEGINETDAWTQNARLEATIANGFALMLEAFSGSKAKPIRPDDLIPRFLPPEHAADRAQSSDDMLAKLKASVGR
jgi:hypothetical protein